MNIITLSEIENWPHVALGDFIEIAQNIVGGQEQNLMFTCYNPVQVICLFCECLDRIGGEKQRYAHDCETTSAELQTYGSKIIDVIDPKKKDIIERIFMSTDFQDRTVLSLITDNEYEELLADFKISALLDQLWKGKESSSCNGKTLNFSLLTHMSQSSVRRLVGQPIDVEQVLEREFVESIKDRIKD